MPDSRDHELFSDAVREQEAKYNWVAAAESYEKALALLSQACDFSRAAQTYERIGFCYRRAAMQAKTLLEFKNRTQQSTNAYTKAAELLEKTYAQVPRKIAEAYHCRGVAAFVSSWVQPDSASRKRKLDKFWKLEKQAASLYEKTDDCFNLGRTYNELNSCLIDRLNLEWDKQRRQEILKEALDYGERAIVALSESGEEYELGRAYCTTSIIYHTAAIGSDSEEKQKYEQKALGYSKKAVELAKETGDHFLLGVSNIALGSAIIDFAHRLDSAAKHFEDALQCGIHTTDNYLIGRASYLLAFLASWKMFAEEDPEKKREESKKCEEYSKDAIRHFSLLSNDQEIASGYYWCAENYNVLAMSVETSSKKKRILLQKSIEAGRKGLEHARLSGSIKATWFILHPLSKSLFLLSTMESHEDAKKRLLEEALRHREENIKALEQAMPYYFWNRGVYHNYLALIQAEMADVERNKEQKVRLLQDAIASSENCIDLCLMQRILSRGQLAALGRYYSDFGRILDRLYLKTGSSELLDKLIEVSKGAVQTYEKANLPSRVSESWWHLARAYNKLRNYRGSAESFNAAAKSYEVAAKELPRLKDFYSDYAIYMRAWSEIEKARHAHSKEEHEQATERYEQAADLHQATVRWHYLSPNYSAWARLEAAETLSRRDQAKKAKEYFQQAARLFAEAKKAITGALDKIELGDEKAMVTKIITASDIRRDYCLGRIAIETAKILDRQGDHRGSSRNYRAATERFQRALDALTDESDRRELRPIIYLSRAWQLMTQAEAEASPKPYLQASQLFAKAKEHSISETAKVLALGHSSFCRALEAGTQFEASRDMTVYLKAKKHLEAAAHYYLKAGFQNASEYARATQRLFDAYLYIDKAETETEPDKKVQYYQIAEKLLIASAGAYAKARHPEKHEEVRRLLESIEEEEQLALSVAKLWHAPTITSTTTSFSTPSPTHERPVGLERFDHVDIQPHLTISPDVSLDEEADLRLDLVNVAKSAGLLVRVDKLVPPGFQVTASLSQHHVDDHSVDLKGKRLAPLKVESIKLRLKAIKAGVVTVRPKVVYVDDMGKFRTCSLEPVSITVHPRLQFEFKTQAAQKAFACLTRAFVQDYMQRRLSLENSGWRTLMEIVRQSRLSKSSVYGARGSRGPALSELERRGLVETRIFHGERGRGGKIQKARITYRKETIKRYIDHHVTKIKEN